MASFTIYWASIDDKNLSAEPFVPGDDNHPAEIRRKKLSKMKTDGKIEVIAQGDDPCRTDILFSSFNAAKEWESFIRELANANGKTIVSTEIR